MSPAAIIADLQRRGFRLRTDGDRLLIAPVARLGDDERTAIRANTPAIVTLLTRPVPESGNVPLSTGPLAPGIATSEARKRSLAEIISIADRVAARAQRPDATPQDRLIAADWQAIIAAKERG